MPARPERDPAQHGGERGGVHKRRIELCGAVGKAHVASARFKRAVEHARNLIQ